MNGNADSVPDDKAGERAAKRLKMEGSPGQVSVSPNPQGSDTFAVDLSTGTQQLSADKPADKSPESVKNPSESAGSQIITEVIGPAPDFSTTHSPDEPMDMVAIIGRPLKGSDPSASKPPPPDRVDDRDRPPMIKAE
jgi:hypothetical protein